MSERIKVKDLQVGMRVRVPVEWLDHPFLLNEFTVRSPRQLAKFAEYGIDEVIVESEMGSPFVDTESVSHGGEKNYILLKEYGSLKNSYRWS